MRKWLLGTETEFGVATGEPESQDPVSSSIFLINSCPALPSWEVLWDYEGENPLLDVRGFEADGEREKPGPEYNRLLNKILANGGRLYVDGAHPEYSTPECTTPRDLVTYEKAGERIISLCREMARQARRGGQIFVYKNNTDGKGNSYGYHENYLISREVSFQTILHHLVPFLVTRQIFAGAGKVGSENRTPYVSYQLSQRADFFEVLVDLNTMVKRPIINTRDEPHADPSRYRRLHVIVGDANMSEVTTYLKVGTTALVLSMMEDGYVLSGMELEDPVLAIKEISRDLSLKRRVKLVDGRELTPIEIQKEYLDLAVRWASTTDDDPIVQDVLTRWMDVLTRLEEDPMLLSREIDWVIKRMLILSYMEKKGCGWNDPRISMMDLQYHDVRSDKGLYYALERRQCVERIVTDEEVELARENPPSDTRAYFRAMCVKKFPKEVYAASWSSVLFDVRQDTIKRVPLLDPYRGTKELVESVFERATSAEELLAEIAA